MGFSWILGEDLTLDLGTSNTLIYSKEKMVKLWNLLLLQWI